MVNSVKLTYNKYHTTVNFQFETFLSIIIIIITFNRGQIYLIKVLKRKKMSQRYLKLYMARRFVFKLKFYLEIRERSNNNSYVIKANSWSKRFSLKCSWQIFYTSFTYFPYMQACVRDWIIKDFLTRSQEGNLLNTSLYKSIFFFGLSLGHLVIQSFN